MKFAATIFVEGEGDVKFLSDFVQKKFKYLLKNGEEIQQTFGKDSLIKFQTNFKQSSGRGVTNLVVFDANGSYTKRLAELELKKVELDIQFETFLFPNDKDSGDFETLLEHIINPDNAFILDCFDNFNQCVVTINPQLFTLNKKTKIHNYISVLVSDVALAKERNRDYLNSEHWNLNSPELTPLYDFLKPYFTEKESDVNV